MNKGIILQQNINTHAVLKGLYVTFDTLQLGICTITFRYDTIMIKVQSIKHQ